MGRILQFRVIREWTLKRPAILGGPAEANPCAFTKRSTMRGVWYLDNELIMSRDRQPGADVVPQINQLLHAAADDILFRGIRRFDGDPFGAQGQGGWRPFADHIDLSGANGRTVLEHHSQ